VSTCVYSIANGVTQRDEQQTRSTTLYNTRIIPQLVDGARHAQYVLQLRRLQLQVSQSSLPRKQDAVSNAIVAPW
jgi:hypothetical protein